MNGETKNSVIDLSYLEAAFDNNVMLLNTILQSFLDDTPNGLIELEALGNAKKWNEVKSTAHKIKTSFNTIGSKKAGSLLQSIESGVTGGDVSNFLSLIEEVKPIAKLVFEEVKSRLNS